MRIFLIPTLLASLALSAASAEAAQKGSGGLNFDCSAGRAPDGQCVCTPPRDSVDCKNMEQYCDGEITCGWAVDDCWCNQKTVFNTVPKGTINVPTTGVLDPGRDSGASGPRGKGPIGRGYQLKR